MVWPLALVAVREEEGDGGALTPLLLSRRDELIDDRLGSVGKVAAAIDLLALAASLGGAVFLAIELFSKSKG